jgi:hypothetical protein
MQIIEIRPKGIYITNELSFEEVQHLLNYLDKVTVSYDSKKEPELHEAVEYVTGSFYPKLRELEENLKNGT